MNPKTYINVIVGVLCLLLIGAGAYGVWSYKSMAAQVATIAPLKADLKSLRESHDKLAAESIQRAEFDTALRAARQSVHISLDKVTHEDPVARDYLGERIPDSVRQAVLDAPQR